MKRVFGVIPLLLVSTGTLAADFYAGLYYTQAENSDFCKEEYFGSSDSCDDKAKGNKLAAGLFFNENFALELARVDSGDLEANYHYYDNFGGGDFVSGNGNVTAEVTGWDLAAKALLPLGDRVSLFVKAGVFKWKSKLSVDWSQSWAFSGDYWSGSGSQSESESGHSTSIGYGVSFKPSESVRLLLEWQSFPNIDVQLDGESFETDLDTTSVGLQFQF